MKIVPPDEISLVEIRWTFYNGFIFSILNINWGSLDAALFGIYWYNAIHIDLFFMTFKLYD